VFGEGVLFEWLAWAFGALVLVLVLSQRSVVFALVLGAIGGLLGVSSHGRRGAAYAGTAIFLGTLLVGTVLGWVAWPLRLVLLPAILATLARQASPDGRPAYRLISSWVRDKLRANTHPPRQPAGGDGVVWAPQVWIAPDECSPVLHYGRVRGPARLVFGWPVVVVMGHGRLVIRPAHGHWIRPGEYVAEVVELDDGQVAEIRP
jgi:hypothetical protein